MTMYATDYCTKQHTCSWFLVTWGVCWHTCQQAFF
nr:MAG TPA: hypothetical protein [Caudoviricetes sp.]